MRRNPTTAAATAAAAAPAAAAAAAATKRMGTDGSIVHEQHDSALPAVVGQQLPAMLCSSGRNGHKEQVVECI